jgi:hypothetical protein
LTTVDQFTRWLCEKCGNPGIASWNKARYDGNPFPPESYGMIFGDNCNECWWPITVRYPAPDMAPRVIYGPDSSGFAYEPDAMDALARSLDAGAPARPSEQRDRDWSGGCSGVPAS